MPTLKREVKREELGLVRPKPDAYDAALAELSRRYAKSDAATRAAMRTLDKTCKTSTPSSASASARPSKRIVDGLTAVAMVEVKRVDFRDVLMSLSLSSPLRLKSRAQAPGTRAFLRYVAARQLLHIANRQKSRSFSMLALADGRLFCLVVARSTEAGVEQVETGESIRRFYAPLSEIMRRHAGAQGDARANRVARAV